MIISTPITREFYPQSGNFSVSAGFSISNLVSPATLGVSGTGGFCGIYFKNGRIYDNANRFVSTYPQNQFFSVNLNINQKNYDVYVDGNPVIFGGNKYDGKSSYLIFNPSIEIDDFTYTLKGHIPDYSVSNNIPFNTQSTTITGQIINKDSDIMKIYSGTFNGDNSTFDISWGSYSLNPNQTGTFIIQVNKTGLNGIYTLENTLYTNFGNVDISIGVSGFSIDPAPYQISLFGSSTIVAGTEESYYGEFSSNNIFQVVPFLQHVQGSGNAYLDIPVSGPYSSNFTGFLNESGLLYSYITTSGTGQGGSLNLTTTGLISGIQSIFGWATGNLYRVIDVIGYGTATVGGNPIKVTGLMQVPVSGVVQAGSGSLNINSNFSQGFTTVYAAEPVHYTPSVGYIYYNAPVSTVTSDLLYIGNNDQAIVYGFHYNTIDELVSYINLNTGSHHVTGYKTDSNTIKLGSLPYYADKPILLKVDPDNDGTMSVSGTGLAGGFSYGMGSGINQSLTLTGNFSGKVNNTGNYSLLGSGTFLGVYPVLDRIRIFEDIWDLSSGLDFFNMVSYKGNNYYNGSGFNSPNPLSNFSLNGIYLNVSYKSSDSRTTDVAKLILSGIGAAAGYYSEIYITGVN